MKNVIERLKANKQVVIRRTLVIAGTVAAITLVGYAYKRGIDATDAVEQAAEAVEASVV